MIITRTPLRISIGGGGTDLESYYSRSGGFVISAAINKYIFIGLNPTFTHDYVIKYSQHERTDSVDEIDHSLVREAFRLHDVEPVEMVSLADIPAGTGLGSSGAFTVGLLRAVYASRREHVTAGALAEEACHIEIDRLGQSVGKQDQYIAAHGGLTCFDIDRSGVVSVSPLRIGNDALHDMEENLLMFFTGYSRNASDVLEDQRVRSQNGDADMLDNLSFVKDIGLSIKEALEAGDTHGFGNLMHEHWLHKQKRSPGMSNDSISQWYQQGLEHGALGGKVVGAGGGGFLLFYATDPKSLRKKMTELGLDEVRFEFDFDGSSVIVRD